MKTPSWREHPVLRRLPVMAALALSVGVLLHSQRQRGVDVEVRYHYGELARGLVESRLTYVSDGEIARRVTYSYRVHAAGSHQLHHLRLRPGVVHVDIDLGYDRSATQAASAVAPSAATMRHFQRTLRIDGPGRYEVALDRGR